MAGLGGVYPVTADAEIWVVCSCSHQETVEFTVDVNYRRKRFRQTQLPATVRRQHIVVFLERSSKSKIFGIRRAYFAANWDLVKGWRRQEDDSRIRGFYRRDQRLNSRLKRQRPFPAL